MEKYIVKVLETGMVTHNVKRILVERPAGYEFTSGQATDISINKPGMDDQLRPFTFTSTTDQNQLEFLTKIYFSHDGITKELSKVEVGDELILHEVFGTINYKGPGLFIAGGSGITPFISIFRDLKRKGNLDSNTLIFVNRTSGDVILKDELENLLHENFISVVETSQDSTVPATFISKEMIKSYLKEKGQFYYVCGPDSFTKIIKGYLTELGIDNEHIIIEQ